MRTCCGVYEQEAPKRAERCRWHVLRELVHCTNSVDRVAKYEPPHAAPAVELPPRAVARRGCRDLRQEVRLRVLRGADLRNRQAARRDPEGRRPHRGRPDRRGPAGRDLRRHHPVAGGVQAAGVSRKSPRGEPLKQRPGANSRRHCTLRCLRILRNLERSTKAGRRSPGDPNALLHARAAP